MSTAEEQPTPEEVERRSRARAHANWIRLVVLATFVFFSMLIFAFLLQRQVSEQHDYARDQCEQRRVNVTKINSVWEALAEIDRTNESITDRVREQRLRGYMNAKLAMPECSAE